MKKVNVGIIGAGNMGEAIINGLKNRQNFCVSVYEKNKARFKEIPEKYGVKKIALKQLTKLSNIIIICVKPQDVDNLLLDIKNGITAGHVLISIAAGISTAHIEKLLKENTAVIRVMPNLPGMIGKGLSAYCLGKYAGKNIPRYKNIAQELFSTLGVVFRIKESRMNAFTALGGSGPGFMAYFIDALQEAAVNIGFNKKEARFISLNVSAGTANMLLQADTDPKEFLKRVASAGGTTEAGLKELIKGKIKQAVQRTIMAAAKRAKELSSPR
ncbi:MAG: pyrroline-5-carboxylate reductase [Candidatus Omnitrophica bacterium]|nr:pyrroline-5-carboxylate reductase [Candidatus Omnitrophota bacterium]